MSQTNYGGANYQVNTGRNNTNIFNVSEPEVPIVGIPNNLPRTHVKSFVGRAQELTQLHEQFQQSNCLAIASIAGMGGIGKTELALQYALHHLQQATYPGGLCWLRARESEVGTQIVNFARSRLGLKLPEGLNLDNQIGFCWQHWCEGEVLMILDDVTDYSLVNPYLPSDSRFKILLTTRLQLGQSFQQLEIKVLDEAAALELLKSLVDADRIDGQLEAAKYLCQWLGYLPLALELVGRYLAQKPDLSLAEMQHRLEAKRLDANALRQVEDGMTAPLGVAAAFELSWQELDATAQELCYLLSLFALAPIQWQWVEQSFPGRNPEDLEDLRDQQLIRLSLLQRSGEQTYLLHQLIREFFQAKSISHPHPEVVVQLKRSICQVMIAVAKQIPNTPTFTLIEQIKPVIPHLEEVAVTLHPILTDAELAIPSTHLSYFYKGQALVHKEAEYWQKHCLEIVTTRLGENHCDTATSMSNLAILYWFQGRYTEAEPLLIQSLQILEQQLGVNHLGTVNSLNNLALVYQLQERYDLAESLYLRLLHILKQQLGENNSGTATVLNNLAWLYKSQRLYDKAEPLFLQSLQITKQQLGDDDPAIARTLNHLGEMYQSQERYDEVEPLLLRALQISQQQLGASHLGTAKALNNLARFYESQERYAEAEPLFFQSLAIREQQLGKQHPDVAEELDKLARFCQLQERYLEAEKLFLKALEIFEQCSGVDHSNTMKTRSNLQALREAME